MPLFTLTAGDDSFPSGAQSNAGADTIRGLDGNDTIFAGGFDTALGGGVTIISHNSVDGGPGSDSINGGARTVVEYNAFPNALNSPNGITYSFATGLATDLATGDVDTPVRVNAILGSRANDTLSFAGFVPCADGSTNSAVLSGLDGLDGNDSIEGSSAGDFLIGGVGNDTIRAGDGDDQVSIGGAGGGGNDSISFAQFAYGGEGNDSFIGTRSYVDGGSGDDSFFQLVDEFNPRNPTLVGGDGADTLGVVGFEAISGQATILFDGGGGDDVVTTLLLEDPVAGVSFAGVTTFLFMGDGADTAMGGTSVDFLDGGAGADTLDGGERFDWLTFASAMAPVTFAFDGSLTAAGDAAGDVVTNVEGVIGSGFGASLAAAATGSALAGGDGNDTLLGRAGPDNLFGGDGDDRLAGGGGVDFADGGAGADSYAFTDADMVAGGFDYLAPLDGADRIEIAAPAEAVFINAAGSDVFVAVAVGGDWHSIFVQATTVGTAQAAIIVV